MKNKGLLLVVFYWIGIILTSIICYKNLYNDLILWTSLFIITLIINRISLDFSKIKISERTIFLTEACFCIYLILILVWGNTHFTLYKLLIVPSVILSIYHVFRLKRIKKNK